MSGVVVDAVNEYTILCEEKKRRVSNDGQCGIRKKLIINTYLLRLWRNVNHTRIIEGKSPEEWTHARLAQPDLTQRDAEAPDCGI